VRFWFESFDINHEINPNKLLDYNYTRKNIHRIYLRFIQFIRWFQF